MRISRLLARGPGSGSSKRKAGGAVPAKQREDDSSSSASIATAKSGLPETFSFEFLREEIVGIDATFRSAFGERLITYADYTASGRGLRFIEEYLAEMVLPYYGNSHTEDDFTGAFMTRALHEAEALIKESVRAGDFGRIIAAGNGSTGAINKLQQLVGVFIPPATRDMYDRALKAFLDIDDGSGEGRARFEEFKRFQEDHGPVVFVGPFEHHSNEVSWRQGLATVIEVDLSDSGNVDLDHLERLLKKDEFRDRVKIGSFSAASNVTGVRTDVRSIAKLLHAHGAIACFDYAASAPYVDIDMSGEDGSHIDAVFISPHKYLAGPGSCGVLVFNEILYRKDLAPTVAGGGTVAYVNNLEQDFLDDTEEREKPGTPNALAEIRAAIAMQLKTLIGVARIEEREQRFLRMCFAKWLAHGRIEVLGPKDPTQRLGIVSFNVRDTAGKWFHPKFMATLLNDVFGIQARGGCSCAGPFGHRILGIDACESNKLRSHIKEGFNGLKLGWCRVGFHYAHDDLEVNFIVDAVVFLANFGHAFIPHYDFDVKSGAWKAKPHMGRTGGEGPQKPLGPAFGMSQALEYLHANTAAARRRERSSPREPPPPLSVSARSALYESYFAQAREFVRNPPAIPKHSPNSTQVARQSSLLERQATTFATVWFRVPSGGEDNEEE